jgi:hypothetical protein
MISWPWVLVVAFGGFILGVIGIAVLSAGRDDHFYRAGFLEGHREGFENGIKSIGGVG